MERLEAIALIESSRAEWDQLIASVPRELMLEPVSAGGWNVKDIIAHVDFYEWWAGEFIRRRDWPIVDESLNTQHLDARNAALYRLNRERSLDDVLASSTSAHQLVFDAVSGLTDAEFNDAKLLLDPPPDDNWSPARLVESSTWRHYPVHAPAIRSFLDR